MHRAKKGDSIQGISFSDNTSHYKYSMFLQIESLKKVPNSLKIEKEPSNY